MPQPIYTFAAPLVSTMRDNMLRTWANGIAANNPNGPAPDIAPGSDMYILCSAVATELAPAMANTVISSDENMPDTCTFEGGGLQRWMGAVGLSRNPAIGSSGNITFSSSVATSPGVFIPTGAQLQDTSQQLYQVIVGGDYYDQQQIPITSLSLGAGTVHANGDTLTWVNGPPFSAKTVQVGSPGGSDGLTGGADAEDTPTGRTRLLTRLQNPPSSGNWSATVGFAESSTPAVEKAFCYPAAQGPATTHVAVTSRATPTLRTRDVPTTVLNATVIPFTQGLLPEHVYSLITTVNNVTANASVLLSIPSAPTASPPGPGGGWINGTPWPSSIGGTAPVTSSTVVSSTHFTVNATTAPQAGVTQVSYLDPTTWTLYTAIVTAVSGTSGAYVITLSAPFVNVAIGSVIFPASQNQAVYVAAFLAAFAAMGPGEKTTLAAVLPRAFRHPTPAGSWPNTLGPNVLKAINSCSAEVLDVQWVYRSSTTTPVPVSILYPPSILVPGNLGLYAA
jgi:hypothetical protein